jgi:hypothetical protein
MSLNLLSCVERPVVLILGTIEASGAKIPRVKSLVA